MPAPRPVNVDYTPLGMVGFLAQRIGENELYNTRHAQGQQIVNSTRQHQLQQREQEFRHAFAMQQAMQSRGGAGQGGTGPTRHTNRPPPLQPEQLQLQQLNAELSAMQQRGTIDPEHADRMRLGAMGVPASLASLGVDPADAQKPLSAQEHRLRANFQLDNEIGALEQERHLAQNRADAFLESLGGVIGSDDERATYDGLLERVASSRRAQADVYSRFATGALPGAAGPAAAPGQQAAPQIPPGTPTATGSRGEKYALADGEWILIQ